MSTGLYGVRLTLKNAFFARYDEFSRNVMDRTSLALVDGLLNVAVTIGHK